MAEDFEVLRKRPLVFVDSLENPSLSDSDFAHLSRSLRVSEGEKICVSDGCGSWMVAAFAERPEQQSEIFFRERSAQFTICFSPVKKVRSEWMVKKLTELGAARVVPFVSDYSVVRWDVGKAEKMCRKHQVVAREAAMQSRNVWLPVVDRLTSFDAVVSDSSLSALVLADPFGRSLHRDDAGVAVGPEGGFSPGELERLEHVALPGGVLRSETAAFAAAVLCGHLRV